VSGLRVKVKSAAYLQSWHQKRLSAIGFDVAPKRPWNAATGAYDGPVGRHSEVYVFCLLAHQDKGTVDPLELEQWRFFVVPTAKLDEMLGRQQRISVPRLCVLGPREVGSAELGKAVNQVA